VDSQSNSCTREAQKGVEVKPKDVLDNFSPCPACQELVKAIRKAIHVLDTDLFVSRAVNARQVLQEALTIGENNED